jgi:mannitol-specific phosphotransferase system IIBC component
MIGTLLTYGIPAVLGFVAGLLVGRKNPSVAAAVAKVAADAQAKLAAK